MSNPTPRPLSLFGRAPAFNLVDLAVLLGLIGALFGLAQLGGRFTGELQPSVVIDLDDPWALPLYTFYSLCRGLIAYVLSLLFTLVYGYWAARDALAEHVLVPLLDILQSIPVLSFLPGLVLALVALFPTRNIGLELACILMIFTGQVWNMTFSFYHSLQSIPKDLAEVADTYRFTWWQRFRRLELPFAAIGLVWNSMMSMAGGWFFLMITESFHLGTRDFRLPGIGSYMQAAVDHERYGAMVAAVLAMVLLIVGLDQFLWQPVVVWSQKFRVEEGGEAHLATSWFLDWLRHSSLVNALGSWLDARLTSTRAPAGPPRTLARVTGSWTRGLSALVFASLIALLVYGGYRLVGLLRDVSAESWGVTFLKAGATLGRVMFSTLLGTLWAVPAGLAIGRSPRLSTLLQPVVQVAASFPAPMLFPLVIAVMAVLHIPLGWGSILLMLLGTQWYILFNVVAGAMAIPADLQEAARSYRITGWRLWSVLLLPAIFPYLVTGWVTAAGGAWNASIVSEYVTFRHEPQWTFGLGAQISQATDAADYPLLAASTVVMALVVVMMNRTLWRSLYALAQTRFSLSK